MSRTTAPAAETTDVPPRSAAQGIAEWIFETVKLDVVEGRLAPDEILVEGGLADRFGVSRGPAREALQRLRRTGFVRAVARVGYIVTAVSLRDYDEVFQMRIALEPLATELATLRASRGQVDLTHLQQLADGVAELADDGVPDRGPRVAQINRDFHSEVARLSGSRRLGRVIDGLLDELQRVMHALAYNETRLDIMLDDHPVLVRVMKQGDAAAARELMHSQLAQAHTLMRELAIGSDVTIGG